MAKRKDLELATIHDELLRAKEEVAKMFEALRVGQISEEEFKRWWRIKVAFKGREALSELLKRREIARGWKAKLPS